MPVSESNFKRLAMIKYLYTLASDQSKLPEPIGCVSILGFHDSIELFLQLACEHLGIGKGDIKFMEYWEVISQKMAGEEISHKGAIRRLNNARVAFKHHGNLPSKLDVDSFRAETRDFYEQNCSRIFGVNFATISLADLVSFSRTRAQGSPHFGNLLITPDWEGLTSRSA